MTNAGRSSLARTLAAVCARQLDGRSPIEVFADIGLFLLLMNGDKELVHKIDAEGSMMEY